MDSALMVCKNFTSNQNTGISQRQSEIIELLKSLGYSVEVARFVPFFNRKKYDLICIQSFPNSWQILTAKIKAHLVWYDAMDSWRKTRKSLYVHSWVFEFIKYLRDAVFTKLSHFANVITYCSKNDFESDQVSYKIPVFILPPNLTITNELKNLPDYGARWVFVGGDDYLPNKLAIDFLKICHKEGRFSDIPLFIYGSVTNKGENIDGINFLGTRPEVELYGKGDIHLAPLWSGAGIKYKVTNPLIRGIRVLSSREGANGIISKNLIIAANKHEFKSLLSQVLFESPRNYSFELENDQRKQLVEYLMYLGNMK